jgi:hypothetical protein
VGWWCKTRYLGEGFFRSWGLGRAFDLQNDSLYGFWFFKEPLVCGLNKQRFLCQMRCFQVASGLCVGEMMCWPMREQFSDTEVSRDRQCLTSSISDLDSSKRKGAPLREAILQIHDGTDDPQR